MSAQLDKLQAQYLFQRYKVKSLYVSVRKTVKQTPFAGLACFLVLPLDFILGILQRNLDSV